MIKAIIIDDEQIARQTLKKMLERYFPDKLQVIAMAESVREGVFEIYKRRPDLVFLDIEMPGENGFKLFTYFDNINFDVIFTTAYKNYAIEAVKVAALDYLLKPVNFIDLMEALKRYEKKKQKPGSAEKIEKLLHTLNTGQEHINRLAIPTFDGFKMERVNHILYCEADQNYTRLFTIRGEVILVSKSLGFMEEMLPNDIFFRIHKSYLVNLNYISSYSKTDGYHVVLDNGTTLDIAFRRNDEFIKALTKRNSQ